MKVRSGILAVFLAGGGALVAVVWLTGDDNLPDVKPSGPQPKVVVLDHKGAVTKNPVHDFGLMEQGSKGKRAFVFKNDGTSDLKLVANYKNANTCECTVSKLTKDVIHPGESAEVEVSWEITRAAAKFSHSARIRTNDPTKPEIALRIKGLVGKTLVLAPSTEWTFNSNSTKEPIKVSGTLYSEMLNDFKILRRIESSHPAITVEFKRLNEDELEDFAGKRRRGEVPTDEDPVVPQSALPQKAVHPKCAYSITAYISPEIPIGIFREKATIHTDIAKRPLLTFYFEGKHTGPIQIYLAPTPGTVWNNASLILTLGRFSASQGKKVKLTMFVKDVEQEMRVSVAKTDPEFLKVTAERTAFVGKNRERFNLTVEVPAGKPPTSRGPDNPAKFILKTNHPMAKEIPISVKFVTYDR